MNLEALCARARERAEEHGEPVVASYVWPGNGADPLERLGQPQASGGFRFAWERPKDGLAIAGGGAALRFLGEGPRRFHDLAERVGTALGLAVTACEGEAPPPVPYALGGFAFFDEVSAADWPGFGAAQLVVPEWMVLRTGGRSHTVVSVPVAAEDRPGERAAFLDKLVARLRKAARKIETTGGRSSAGRLSRGDEVEGHRHWFEIVTGALEKIRAGRLSKVVLARAVELFGDVPRAPQAVLRALRSAYPDCFSFIVDPGAGQMFLGATPERLARLEGGALQLGAMAGSTPRGDRPDADEALGRRLMSSPKEREEHAIVVEAILEAVRPLGGEIELPDQPRLVKLTNVQHLYTPITVRAAEPPSLLPLLARLHPTPAVGGHPRAEALEMIQAVERFDRGWYAGPVGWIDGRGGGDFVVTIRSALLREQDALLYAGCGIVAGSNPEREYQESCLKLQPMLWAINGKGS
ncbi:MAG: isochorismate synthase [SAR324 cluster bacterium]|nr:isochorismate synthase [SAR324 cluster bacterium]